MNFFILLPKEIAKERGILFYFNGSVCARGNVWLRRSSTGNCVCALCRKVKNEGNSKHYHTVKNSPDFVEKVRRATARWKERKKDYDRAYRERTRDRQNEKSRKWAADNPEKRRAICQNYSASRRAIESHGLSAIDLAEWKRKQKKSCYWCGKTRLKTFHVDHYIPLSRGGTHEIENLVIACAPCNLRKNSKDPYEFAASVGRLF